MRRARSLRAAPTYPNARVIQDPTFNIVLESGNASSQRPVRSDQPVSRTNGRIQESHLAAPTAACWREATTTSVVGMSHLLDSLQATAQAEVGPVGCKSAAVFPMDLRNPFGPYGCSICCPLGDTLSPQRVRVCGGQRQCREDWIDNGSDCFIYPINTGEFGPTMWDERLRLGGKI